VILFTVLKEIRMKIDLTYLKNMSEGNKDLILEMIGIFKSQVSEFNQSMDEYYASKQYELLGRLAHKAKSSISIMGLNELAIDLKNFENLAKSGLEIEKYPGFIKKFKSETADALEELDDVARNIDIYI
jgi:HPt (histidine-containing phosphotransfer) domain-containing protein